MYTLKPDQQWGKLELICYSFTPRSWGNLKKFISTERKVKEGNKFKCGNNRQYRTVSHL